MLPMIALTLAIGAEPIEFAKEEAEQSIEINAAELKAHVYRLASSEFLGRRGPGAARASRHIAEHFEKLKLKPLFGNSYFQEIPWLSKNGEKPMDRGYMGRNVGVVIPGSDPVLKDEWVVLSAHFDHLGMNGSRLYPGADDNASGTAMVMEVAEYFALSAARPKRTLVLIAFDLEEVGLIGSTYFISHPPFEVKKLRAFMTADMLGRSMANVMNEYVFVLGSENSAELRQLVDTRKPADGVKVGRIGADIIGTRSDYGPFRDRRVPFLFFCTGMHADYHTAGDTPDKIDYVRLEKTSRWICDLTSELANTDKPPTWAKDGLPPDLDEVRSIHTLLSRIMSNPKAWPMTEKQRELVVKTTDRLKGYLDKGKITLSERTALLWTARLLMAGMFN
jgi:hypothetical protein